MIFIAQENNGETPEWKYFLKMREQNPYGMPPQETVRKKHDGCKRIDVYIDFSVLVRHVMIYHLCM